MMCTQRLWRALGHAGRPPRADDERAAPGGLLGLWALKLIHYKRKPLVLALNGRTYLTLLFPLAPRVQFRRHFAQALTWVLEDLKVDPEHVVNEVMVVDFLPLTRLTSRTMVGSLNDLEFLAHCELDYLDDLRLVQRNLNEVPHVRRTPSCPITAVVQLFGAADAPAEFRTH